MSTSASAPTSAAASSARSTVLAISGSIRTDSHNTRLLRAAQKFNTGQDIEIYDGLRDIPPYDQDLDTPELRPAAVNDLRRRSRRRTGCSSPPRSSTTPSPESSRTPSTG
ncbi:hypothetical protein SNARM312S_01377 [Streptomyces narbonensis]